MKRVSTMLRSFRRLTALALAFSALHALGVPSLAATGEDTWVSKHMLLTFGKFNHKPLVWRVLETYTSDGADGNQKGRITAFLLTDELLSGANVRFNADNSDNAWDNSDIKAFLNGEKKGQFLNAFSAAEKAAILESEYRAGGISGGSGTVDSSRIFLLSVEEARSKAYFTSDQDRAAAATMWWLRSPGNLKSFAAYVDYYGAIEYGHGSEVSRIYGIRPAMRVSFSPDEFARLTAASMKQSAKPFTADDFDYIAGFSVKADKGFKKDFNIPTRNSIVYSAFWEPRSEKEERLTASQSVITLVYNFGTVTLEKHNGNFVSCKLEITNDALRGPRNTYMGDTAQKVLARFKNKYAGKSFPAGAGELYLYDTGSNPRHYALAQFSDGALAELTYQQENSRESVVRVKYGIKKGVVNSIVWEIFWV